MIFHDYTHFRAGTAVTTLDNNGRTPLQLAQSKLKLLQRNSPNSDGMSRVSLAINCIQISLILIICYIAGESRSQLNTGDDDGVFKTCIRGHV